MATSSRPRPCANPSPDPAATANSVGAVVPGPNGSWPPRTPNRIGENPPPSSAPADQLHVSNAPAPDQERHAPDAAKRALGLGAKITPPPTMVGRSVSAVTSSATLARSR